MVRIELRTLIEAPCERCFDLARCIELHLLGTEQTGEQAVAGVTKGLIGDRQFVRWRATHFGVRQHLTSGITAFERPVYFQDSMLQGAFRSMMHDHFFRPVSDGGVTEMRDVFWFTAPLPVLGYLAEKLFLERYMRGFLLRRNAILKRVAESEEWREMLPESAA